jgi:hypothetical protein
MDPPSTTLKGPTLLDFQTVCIYEKQSAQEFQRFVSKRSVSTKPVFLIVAKNVQHKDEGRFVKKIHLMSGSLLV